MTPPMVLDGAMNGVAFRASVEQVLVSTLAPGEVGVMDSRRSRVAPKTAAWTAEGARTAIEIAGATLRFQPNAPTASKPRDTMQTDRKARWINA